MGGRGTHIPVLSDHRGPLLTGRDRPVCTEEDLPFHDSLECSSSLFKNFISFWLRWVFAAVGLSPVAAHGLLIAVASPLLSTDSGQVGFSSCSLWAL